MSHPSIDRVARRFIASLVKEADYREPRKGDRIKITRKVTVYVTKQKKIPRGRILTVNSTGWGRNRNLMSVTDDKGNTYELSEDTHTHDFEVIDSRGKVIPAHG